MITWHEPENLAKVQALANAMEASGWYGAPLVRWGEDQLLTGAHRYTAAKSIGWPDFEIPTIDIADVFAEDDQDFEALMTEESGDIVYVIRRYLSAEMSDKYGIDIE